MSILMYEQLKENLSQDLKNVENDVSIISAYCKKSALELIDEQIGEKENISKRIIVRFLLDDILSKATDIEIYDYCKEHNWKLYIKSDIHAKIYSIDQNICYIGSANATNNGLSINKRGNLEMTKKIELDSEEIRQIERVFRDAILLDEETYNKMKEQVDSIEYKPVTSHTWNKDIIPKKTNTYNVLFEEDFPVNEFPTEMKQDEVYLDIYKDETIEVIKEKFYNTKIMQWLIEVLEKEENNELYFGKLSEMIQNIIFQDPKQYRKDVKELQAKLYNWIEALNYDNLEIDVPGTHSQRIRLIK